VNESIALGVALLIGGYLAAKDVAEGGESVVDCLVIDGLVEVLDEHVANAGAAEGGIALGPHNANGLVADQVEVHGVQSTLSCG